jgi:hypothetical protein
MFASFKKKWLPQGRGNRLPWERTLFASPLGPGTHVREL